MSETLNHKKTKSLLGRQKVILPIILRCSNKKKDTWLDGERNITKTSVYVGRGLLTIQKVPVVYALSWAYKRWSIESESVFSSSSCILKRYLCLSRISGRVYYGLTRSVRTLPALQKGSRLLTILFWLHASLFGECLPTYVGIRSFII